MFNILGGRGVSPSKNDSLDTQDVAGFGGKQASDSNKSTDVQQTKIEIVKDQEIAQQVYPKPVTVDQTEPEVVELDKTPWLSEIHSFEDDIPDQSPTKNNGNANQLVENIFEMIDFKKNSKKRDKKVSSKNADIVNVDNPKQPEPMLTEKISFTKESTTNMATTAEMSPELPPTTNLDQVHVTPDEKELTEICTENLKNKSESELNLTSKLDACLMSFKQNPFPIKKTRLPRVLKRQKASNSATSENVFEW